jgi:hypothetical protein
MSEADESARDPLWGYSISGELPDSQIAARGCLWVGGRTRLHSYRLQRVRAETAPGDEDCKSKQHHIRTKLVVLLAANVRDAGADHEKCQPGRCNGDEHRNDLGDARQDHADGPEYFQCANATDLRLREAADPPHALQQLLSRSGDLQQADNRKNDCKRAGSA